MFNGSCSPVPFLVIQTVAHDPCSAASIKIVRQLAPCGVVHIDDTGLRSSAEAAVEQLALGGEIIFHRAVIIQMIARQVGEDCNRVLERVATMQVYGLR